MAGGPAHDYTARYSVELAQEYLTMPPENRYPSVPFLHAAAKKRLPKFSYDYVNGGTGPGVGQERNRTALDAVTMTPRYVTQTGPAETDVEIFGRKFARPFGIAPMGLASLQVPDAELKFARAAKAADMPVGLSTACTVDIEEFGAIAGSNGWFQLYPPKDEAVNDDLIKRASDAGFGAMFVTVDVPASGWRPHDAYNGLAVPPRITPATIWNAAMRPCWSLSTLAAGIPHFKTLGRYSPDKSMRGMADFVSTQLGNPTSADRLKRIRDLWKGDLIIKGVMHPADAERLGFEEGQDIQLASRRGEIVAQLHIVDRMRRGELFVPFVQLGGVAVNFLTNDALDEAAGIPEYKACAVRVEAVGTPSRAGRGRGPGGMRKAGSQRP